jgi:HD-like signal output (HDOD) protein
MRMSDTLLSHPGLLRRFSNLQDLSDEQLALLVQSQKVRSAAKGTRIMARGDSESFSLFLLSGELELTAADGVRQRILADSESARMPIARLVPRRYDVIARTEVDYLKVDSELLEELREASSQLEKEATVLVEDGFLGTDQVLAGREKNLLKERIYADLDAERLSLPSLPDVALRIGHALNEDVTDASRIARIIQTDPAMAAKVVRAANSALYMGRQPVDSCVNAVVRLGLNTTHKLVLSFALREVFRSRSGLLQKQMQKLWSHSTQVAAISAVLARLLKRFDPEHAMLAGLVHDIGSVAVLSYAERFPELSEDQAQIAQAVNELRGDVGALILQRWEFAKDFVITARDAEKWTRDPAPEPDYCDLVIIAQLHSYVGTRRMSKLPPMDQLACFNKLGLETLTPRQSLKILDQAKEQIESTRKLLQP